MAGGSGELGYSVLWYCLAVPANRLGSQTYTLAQLKTIQEVLSLVTFVGVAWVMFDTRPTISQAMGFVLIALGAWFVFKSPFG